MHRAPAAAGVPAGFVFEELGEERAKSSPGVGLFAIAGAPVVVIDGATDDLKVG